MTTDKRERFELAYTEWKTAPVELSEASAPLADASQSLHQTQEAIRPMLAAYRESGTILPPPIAVGWFDGMSFITGRNIRQIRRHKQTGRNQVATRDLLEQAERLKRAWDAYRTVTCK